MIIALTATVSPTVGSSCSCPGFGALIAIIGLVAVAWIVFRRRP